MPLFNQLVLPNFAQVTDTAKTVNDLVDRIQTAAIAVNVAVGIDSTELVALEGVATLTNIKGVSAAIQKKWPNTFTQLGSDVLGIAGAIFQIAGAVTSLDQDVADMLTAGSVAAIGQVASQAASDAEKLIGIVTKALADVATESIKNTLTIVGASDQYKAFTEYLSDLLNEITPKPFEDTVIAASLLDDNVQQLNPDTEDYHTALANLQHASMLLAMCEAQPCQPDPPTKPGPKGSTTNETASDPNALIGPAGYGTQSYIEPLGSLPYTVEFENDGSVAAQNVTVTQELNPNLDWSTFQLGSFGFGSINVDVPAGLTQYQTTVAYQNIDDSSLNVLVALDFNVQSGLLTVTFTSLDPLTGQAPSGVTDGFLPPDNSAGIGEGYVQYTVESKSNLTTGTTINQQASVVFDINAPISTNTAVNTIDTAVPISSVSALPVTETTPSFTVSWSGNDGGGSGIASYNVYVSENGGAFTPFLTGTTQTSATFTGVVGDSYSFFSVATSNVGLVQPTPAAGQATTKVVALSPPPPLVTMTAVHEVMNKKHQVTEVLVTFSGA